MLSVQRPLAQAFIGQHDLFKVLQGGGCLIIQHFMQADACTTFLRQADQLLAVGNHCTAIAAIIPAGAEELTRSSLGRKAIKILPGATA